MIAIYVSNLIGLENRNRPTINKEIYIYQERYPNIGSIGMGCNPSIFHPNT